MTGGRRPIEELEALLGDPFDEGGEFSYGRILAADSDRRLVGWAEAVLQDWGFSAELVPNRLGGRWISTEDMVRRLSPIFRRDPALGLGHGVTTLMAACNVWVGGDEQAQTGLASRLLHGDRVAVAFHELAHGNDLLGNELIAEQTGAGAWRVSGRKEVINNIDRAPAVLLFARTGQSGSASGSAFSLLLWKKSVVLGGSADTTARIWTTGVRGCQIGVATFDGLLLPATSLIGAPGDGVATALRAFQVTRSVVPALACATLSAAVGMSVPYMTTRGLYGGTVWDLPHARGLLVRAWGRLIVGEALARVSVRSLHVRPDESFLLSAATKYLVPELLNQAMQHLTTLFGSSFYTVSPPYGAIEKWLRDLAVVPIGHAGSRSCLQSLVPNLPTWARRSRRQNTSPPELFSSGNQLGELDFSELTIGAGKSDSLVGVFEDEAVKNALTERFPDLKDQMDDWAEELTRLREDASALRPAQLGADASPDALAAGRRQALLFAAAALVGTWLHNRHDVNSAFHGSGTALRAGLALLADLSLESAPLTTGVLTDVVATGWSTDLELAAAEHIRKTHEAGRSLGIEELPLSVAPDRSTETSEEP
ncbi:acyl-CoA dehydrogenase [Curtobacterium flaccumfaciens]|uniref:acyl-CoA dehydrogenase n=1 Tax=Curtobacterium flaccumfaciens TaxID=2035 RepID=UPI00112EDD73|nr:acyl-CoA dehydrogenase [Curtobacterium flaccumfaciens]TPG05156.1 acyl-CoA dehydrogenase [Curtobacterium flaccumfaciens]